jgi:CheY-like chemotaxis protein
MRSDKRRVLVVEDDPLTTGAIKMLLEWEGYQVDCAANGLEALNHLRKLGEKPDVILLDVVMPVLDGRQFREQQKDDPEIHDIPVIVVSAADTFALDAADYIQKPFLPQELLQAVHSQM